MQESRFHRLSCDVWTAICVASRGACLHICIAECRWGSCHNPPCYAFCIQHSTWTASEPRLLGLSQARRKVLKRLKQVDHMLAMRWQCDGIRARPMRRCASMQDAGQGPRASANFTGLSDVPGGNSTLFTFALNYDTAAGAALAQQRPSGIGDTHRLCFQTVFRRHSA